MSMYESGIILLDLILLLNFYIMYNLLLVLVNNPSRREIITS